MSKNVTQFNRRGFLKGSVAAGAAAMAPMIIPSSALGQGGAVAPSERIVVGGIGIGNRGTYDLGCFLEQKDVQFVAVCDVKEKRRVAVKKKVDEHHGNQNCAMYRDFRELLGPQRYRRGADRHRTELALHGRHQRGPRRQGHVLREAVHEEHLAKPAAGRDDAPHGPRLPSRHAAAELAPLRVRLRAGSHRKARQAQEGLRPPGGDDAHDQRLAPRGEGPADREGRLEHVPRTRRLASV